MPNAPLLEICIFATIAVVILVRLYTVLGRRNGYERSPPPADMVRGQNLENPRPAALPVTDLVAQGLSDIKLADRNFDAAAFLSSARSAYERITTAFAAGDRAGLRPLLSDEVYGVFDSVIAQREARKESVAFTFSGFKDVKIVQAVMREHNAEITLSFGGQFVSATSNEKGEIIEGDAGAVRDVTDLWTFARDVRGRDPNWLLVATAGELP